MKAIAPHEHRVDTLGKRGEQSELVGDLRATDDRDVGPRRVLEEHAEVLYFVQQRQPCRRWQQRWDPDHRSVGSVGRAKGIEHERIVAVGELLGKARIVRGLSGVEPKVLEYLDPRRELLENLGDRRHRVASIDTLRPPEVRAQRDVGPASAQELHRRQRRADPEVVGHHPLTAFHGERDVEISTNEDPTSPEVTEVLDAGQLHQRAPSPPATISTRSRSRCE